MEAYLQERIQFGCHVHLSILSEGTLQAGELCMFLPPQEGCRDIHVVTDTRDVKRVLPTDPKVVKLSHAQ
jgi:hypothetical protein